MGIGGLFFREELDDREHIRLLQLGIELGMTLIDTAEVYGAGHAEELVGAAVQGIRDRVFIATKFSPEHSAYHDVVRSAEGSLRRLDTDYIDLYQAHWPNPQIPIEETIQALEKLVDDGKVRFVGLSNFSVAEMRQVQSSLASGRLVATQQEYSLLERTMEQAVIPFCHENGLSMLAYSPLAQGKLASNDYRLGAAAELSTKYNLSPAQLALNWVVRDPKVLAIPKASTERHVRENAMALTTDIASEDLERLSTLFEPQVCNISTERIEVADDPTRDVYKTLAEALENRHHMVPSPVELAKQIQSGEVLKPIKVRNTTKSNSGMRYLLIEGRLRYWAWVIAHDGNKPIPALIDADDTGGR